MIDSKVETKLNVYNRRGILIGYFRNPEIKLFSENEYEIKGMFYSVDGSLFSKLDFNPQALPYWAVTEGIPDMEHRQLTNVYVQSGRQPVQMSCLGNSVNN